VGPRPILTGDVWDPDSLRIDPQNKRWKIALGHYERMARECYAERGRSEAAA